MSRKPVSDPDVIPNGYCQGCKHEAQLYRVSPSRYRCGNCFEKELGYRPWLEPREPLHHDILRKVP